MTATVSTLTPTQTDFLRQAARYLERPRLLMRLADLAGRPIEELARRMPVGVAQVGEAALRKLLTGAVMTIPTSGPREGVEFESAYATSGWTGVWHMMAAGASGAAGGFLGLTGLALELPISTGILFRSIASIAHDFGEDIRDKGVRLECLTVFSHGGRGPAEAMESSYFTTRLALAELVRESTRFLAKNSAEAVAEAVARGTAPYVIGLIARIAARFNIAVSEKFLAQSMPVFGAVGGAAVNTAFADHFNTVARYHFGIRKLEREVGKEVVQAAYEELRQQDAPARG